MAQPAGACRARVGILGCGTIGRKNSRAILRSSRAELGAVASRNLDKCHRWCDELQLPAAVKRYGSYEDVISDASLHIVYIALPTVAHLEWVKKAAAAGKHVLVEKPVARTAEEAREMIVACRSAGVQLMDGLMFVHHARFGKILRIFEDPITWQPVRVTAAFTFKATAEYLSENIRVKADGDPLGCLGDLGWYLIRVGLAAFRWTAPSAVVARIRASNAEGVPLEADVDLLWPADKDEPPAWATSSSAGDGAKRQKLNISSERVCTFHCSFLHPWRQWYEAVSLNGKIVRCQDLCVPRCEEICTFEIEQTVGTAEVDSVSIADRSQVPTSSCCQEVCMWDNFAGLVLDGCRDPACERTILLTQAILDAALESGRSDGKRVAVTFLDN